MSAAALRKVESAMWWALSEQAFYGSLLMRLSVEFSASVPVAATDGRRLILNPAWVESASPEQLRFVLLHEVLHCAHGHMWRLPADEAGNHAGDHEINLTLTGANGGSIPGITMPDGGLCDIQYRGLSCEEILARLPQDPPSPPQPQQDDAGEDGQGGSSGDGQDDASGHQGVSQGQGQGNGKPDACGSFLAPGEGAGDAQSAQAQAQQAEQLKQEWEQAVIQAAQAQQASGQGNLPADMQRRLEKLKHQRVDWRAELSDWIRQAGAGRQDWTRSARRHAWQSVVYPRRLPSDLGTIVVVRDTSGSISDAICAEFNAAIDACAEEHASASLLVLDCDAAIQAEYRCGQGVPCPETAKGGGGTDFRSPFRRAQQLADEGETIAGLVYLTDLAGTFGDEPQFPTLWLSIAGGAAPFGRTVKLEL